MSFRDFVKTGGWDHLALSIDHNAGQFLLPAFKGIKGDSNYKFYKEHMQECIDGYHDCMDSAKTSEYFAGNYYNLVDRYEEMATTDLNKIKAMEKKVAQKACIGVGFLVIGGVLIYLYRSKNPGKKKKAAMTEGIGIGGVIIVGTFP